MHPAEPGTLPPATHGLISLLLDIVCALRHRPIVALVLIQRASKILLAGYGRPLPDDFVAIVELQVPAIEFEIVI